MKKLFYTHELLENTISMIDFYKKIGVISVDSNGEEHANVADVKDILMNSDENLELLECLKRNKKKNPECKQLSDAEYEKRVSWDWGCYSPTSKKDVPRGEIWINT